MENKLKNIIGYVEESVFCTMLGLRVICVNKGLCEMYLPVSYESGSFKKRNLDQSLCMAACHLASFVAACTTLSDGEYPVTYSANLSVLSPVSEGGLTIYSHAVETEHGGFVESEVYDDKRELVALGSIRY